MVEKLFTVNILYTDYPACFLKTHILKYFFYLLYKNYHNYKLI